MFASIGIVSLIIACLINLSTLLLCFTKKIIDNKVFVRCLVGAFFFTTVSFLGLIISYIISDYSVLNVFQNSHQLKPLIYKISGVWGNHAGSMLLWLWLFSFITSLFAFIHKNQLNKVLTFSFSTIQIIFSLFILIFASPFIRIYPVPTEGLGLNPLLQDIGLALHPPFLYLGYVISIIPYSYVVGLLFYRKISEREINLFIRYTILSWSCLSIGILLGSWWAYRELGWGGFWYWDPVENISLIPWFLLTAQFHLAIFWKRSNIFILPTIVIAIISFISSIFGTFLVRSGLLTSVHSFAGNGDRANFILVILIIFSLANLIFFLIRYNKTGYEKNYIDFFSRENAIFIGNLILIICAVTIIFSILYPIAYNYFTNMDVSVGPDYFDSTIVPLFLISVVFITIFSAKNNKFFDIKFYVSFIISLSITIITYFLLDELSFIALLAIFSSIFLVLNMLACYIYNIEKLIAPKNLAHLSLAVLIISIYILNSFGEDKLVNLKLNETNLFLGNEIILQDLKYGYKDNYIYRKAIIKLKNLSNREILLEPERRLYPAERTQTAEASIYHHIFYDIYALIGDLNDNNELIIRLYYRPMISFVWFSVIVMSLSGFLVFIKRNRNF